MTPRPLDRAQLWASPGLIDDVDVVTADWLHAVVIGALLVVPLAMWLLMRSPDPGAARTILRGDLLTIPLGVVFTCIAYVGLRRVRRRRARVDGTPDFDAALRTVLDALAHKAAVSPSTSASDAKTFRLRMDGVRRYTATE